MGVIFFTFGEIVKAESELNLSQETSKMHISGKNRLFIPVGILVYKPMRPNRNYT
jgi:hypothetical protein